MTMQINYSLTLIINLDNSFVQCIIAAVVNIYITKAVIVMLSLLNCWCTKRYID